MSIFAEIMAGAQAVLAGISGESATYDGAAGRLTVTVRGLVSKWASTDAYGVTTTTTTNDWRVDVAELVADGERFEPEPGDVITIRRGQDSQQFEVMQPPGNEPCFRFSDSTGLEYQIHTKRIKTD